MLSPHTRFHRELPLGSKLPICLICNEPVVLESSKTDENGKAIHEACYLLKVGLRDATTTPSKP